MFFFSSRRRHTRLTCDWSSDVCSSDLWEGKSGYGLDRDTELASLRAIRRSGGSSTWLGAHAVPPEHPDADEYIAFALAERSEERRVGKECGSRGWPCE